MILRGHLNVIQRKQRTISLLKNVGLEDRMLHLPSELSGGEMQRTAIARALANMPDILFLDEPTGDLDTKNTIEVMDLLLDINLQGFIHHDDEDNNDDATTKGITFVMVTHNPDLECYADRILYVRDGQIEKQCINETQRRIHLDSYLRYLSTEDEN
eukprot:TRINITY_DN69125_c0_g3_i1.p2 TRINITY_DN69125_c0_g3~~TRINITY_DN69125_c0_g3_i1.p2  ORF type:complete len:157 (+),score=16.93 TRINITY_DN69125_c0_g3_i1:926-1396(+)